MRKFLLWTGIILVVLFIAGAVAWHWMTGPLYHPGDVRAGKDVIEPLTPLAADAQHWKFAPNIELHHFEEGTGSEILIVHGGPGFPPTQTWAAGRFLADRYKLIYYHQRGCGLSSRPIASFSDPNMFNNMKLLHKTLGLPAQVADIERIRRVLGVEKLTLIGHSFGADIAALYAVEFPEHVRALIFVAPANLAVLPMPGLQSDLFDMVRHRLPPSMKDEYESYMREYFDFRKAFRRTEPESSAFYGKFGRYYGAATGMSIPVDSDASSAGYAPLAIYVSMGKHHDYTAAFRSVTAPVLVIHGGNDLQPEATSKSFAALFPNSQFVRIEGASHFVFDDRPEEFASDVSKFLEGIKH